MFCQEIYSALCNKGNKPFQVIYRYIPVGEDDLTYPGLEAMGPDRNQLPIDRNVTFFFSYTEGDGSNVFYIDLFLILLHVIPRHSMPYIKFFKTSLPYLVNFVSLLN